MQKTMFYQIILRPRWAEMQRRTNQKCQEDTATGSKEKRLLPAEWNSPATRVDQINASQRETNQKRTSVNSANLGDVKTWH